MAKSQLTLNLRKHFLIILFLLFYFCITAYKFLSHKTPFYDWDESIYAQVGREMVQKKSLVPLWQGQNWLDKPPLTPLAYGIVEAILPIMPEISTRLFTLLLSVAALGLTYLFYYRLTKNKIIPLLTVIITAFTPIFLQRTQVLNVDVFLLLGWVGYLVFSDNFWLSLFFLVVGVLSKSLLGFYPVIGLFLLESIQLYLKNIKLKEYSRKVKSMFIQVIILSLWFLIMFATFKFAFIKNQFLEAMLKRVTSSIESHFGERTFYITTLFEQLKLFAALSLIGIILLAKELFQKKDFKRIILAIFFVPWFLFLNLTKTKISWYLYPVLAQFAFLGVYFLLYFKKYIAIFSLIALALVIIVLNQAFLKDKFFNTFYSSYDQYYQLAIYAGKNCSEVELLVDPDTRQTYDTLNSMGLTISTTKWWGNHPAIVFYSAKKVNFVYDTIDFQKLMNEEKNKTCFVLNDTDLKYLNENLTLLNKFKEVDLFIK